VSDAGAGLRDRVERLFAAGGGADREEARAVFAEVRGALSRGEVRRPSRPASPTGWRVNAGSSRPSSSASGTATSSDASMDHGRLPFFDKDTLP